MIRMGGLRAVFRVFCVEYYLCSRCCGNGAALFGIARNSNILKDTILRFGDYMIVYLNVMYPG